MGTKTTTTTTVVATQTAPQYSCIDHGGCDRCPKCQRYSFCSACKNCHLCDPSAAPHGLPHYGYMPPGDPPAGSTPQVAPDDLPPFASYGSVNPGDPSSFIGKLFAGVVLGAAGGFCFNMTLFMLGMVLVVAANICGWRMKPEDLPLYGDIWIWMPCLGIVVGLIRFFRFPKH